MQITRAKAVALLNKGEMQLYDDSRHNPIRKFSVSQLESRITRARGVRDRARDLVRRQKLSSRQQTGSKRGTSGNANQRSKDKVEILADILKRFETRLGDAKKEAKASEKESAASPRVRKAAVKKAGVQKTARKKTAGKKTARKGTDGTGKRVTAKQALRSTRKVLAAKQEAARQPKPWQEVGSHGGQVSGEGFQSGSAARRAADLHAGEARLPAIHGSSATRDRISQGKRDSHDSGD
ncbi:MAG TPA: hypothetical protein H9827_02750 [Candidatus Luteimonas excrementigallinarum]|nr:hypothetical protein [Candidatus Luteimonas excrementigallinarum]